MHITLIRSAIAAATALVLAACGGSTDESGVSGTGSTSAPRSDTRSSDPDASVHVGVGLEPTSLDITTTSGAALQQVVLGNIYESLVGRTPEGEVFPVLAEDWEVSEDNLDYTFHMRDGLTFHDGSELTSTDVLASLEKASAEGSLNPDAKRLAAVDSIEAPDEQTVVITLSEPDINLLDSLTTGAGVVIPSDNEVDLASETNGSGPYRVSQWVTGSTITLERVEDYWGEPADNSEVVFHYFTDSTAAINALTSGEIDILTNATPEAVSRFEGNDAYDVVEGASTSWMTLGFNHDDEVLADADVRHAIRQAIDKEGLITTLGGQAVQVGSMVSPVDPWYEDFTAIDAYDPEGVQQLLAEAGQEDLELTLKVADIYDTAMVEYVAAQLGAAGIDVAIETMEFSTWLEEVYTDKDYQMTIVLHVDPWTLTYYGNPEYYWNYDNPEAQELMSAAMQASSLEERDENLQNLARVVAEDAASDWLYSPVTTIIADADVTGYPTDRIVNYFLVSDIQVGR